MLLVLQHSERPLGGTDVEVDIGHEVFSGCQGAVSAAVLSTHPIDFGNSMRPMRVLSDYRKADGRQLPLWVGSTRSLYWKAAVRAEHRVNGSNQRDTGHWIWSAPPAAMAENRTLGLASVNAALGESAPMSLSRPLRRRVLRPAK